MQSEPDPNKSLAYPFRKQAPKVSVGMPVYNGEKSIRKAVDSILSQTFTDFELIISDNASTDKTEEICREYARRDNRVVYFRQPENCGPTRNFQFVLEEASGEYFMWAAHDDFRASDCLEYYLEHIKDSNAFFSTFESIDLEDAENSKHKNPPLLSGIQNEKKQDLLKYIKQMCPTMVYGLFKTEYLIETGLKTYDWADSYLVAKYIKLYGYKTELSESKFTYGFSGKYVIKTVTQYLNPFYFLKDIFFLLVPDCGIGGVIVFGKKLLLLTKKSLVYNVKKICSSNGRREESGLVTSSGKGAESNDDALRQNGT